MRWCISFKILECEFFVPQSRWTRRGGSRVKNRCGPGAVDDQCIGKPKTRKNGRPAPWSWAASSVAIRSDQAAVFFIPLAAVHGERQRTNLSSSSNACERTDVAERTPAAAELRYKKNPAEP